ncbi:putative GAF sensor protein [Anaeromyxobacter dehalogenans 2CP-1]|uniref:GAF sensor protein n=1 Tax=Anaeromyxobacter dehalogenans (strain ATCC BAA-258 / DSM 21875 / 2CP-1) TaxID=455488 RepID=B8J7C9_ANAD2|nr:GAF domain-containing protein [Anaeromyxobacter dehalogenans]ACL67109.1 putative GAF sensor protein [Anaeromyxobacter dehalogenans 2CP-1]
MAQFEIFVPATPPAQAADVVVLLEADSWLGALRAGVARIGGRHPANVLCDVRPGGVIHVTDPETGRAFRIQELPEAAVRPARTPPPGSPPAPARPRRPARDEITEKLPLPGAARRGEPPPPRRPPAPIGREPAPRSSSTDALLAGLTRRAAALPGVAAEAGGGLGALLDLALELTGCEAGSVFLLRPGERELSFAVARGPAAGAILRRGVRVPVGAGVVGFCVQENVALAVSDVRQDPRFDDAVARAAGYEARSLLCTPIARGGRVLGAMEVMNKRGGELFDQQDVAVLALLADHAAARLGA